MSEPCKVIVVDDESIIRMGLESWLQPSYQVSTFDSAEAFLQAYEDGEIDHDLPTCVLLDFQLPGMNGVELQNCLRIMNAAFPIIFMSGNAQQAEIIDAWRGGAVDFLLKPFQPQDLSHCLEKQFTLLSSKAFKKPKLSANSTNILITKREAEVLVLLAKGHQQIDVANRLGISVRTVKMYRTFLKNKLGLNTLAELGRYYETHQQQIEQIAKSIER